MSRGNNQLVYGILLPVDSSESRGVAQAETVIGLSNARTDIRVTILSVFDDEDRAGTGSPYQIPGGKEASGQAPIDSWRLDDR